MVVRSLRDKLRARFNASVAETALQDAPDRGELSVAVIALDSRSLDQALDTIDAFVAADGRARITRVTRDRF